jgi:hypothetical protein
MVQKVKHILENPYELNRISVNGLILAKDHTYKKRVSIIEQAYNTIRKKI